MTNRLHLVCGAAAIALFAAACDPATPTDPEPLTPPEEAAATPAPAIPATSTSGMTETADTGTETPVRELGTECGTVTAEGLCGVEFGMTADDARAAHQGELYNMGDSGTGDDQACMYLGPKEDNYDVGYMLVDGTVQRIDIRAPGVATGEAVQVGMLAGEVEGIYPDLERQPNKYSEYEDLIVQLSGEAKLIMETDENGLIASYRIGLPPAVDYVEGCG